MSMLRPLLLLAIAIGGLLATGYQWGAGRERAAHQAEQNRAAKLAQERFDAEVLRGDAAVTQLLADRAIQQADFATLEKAFNELLARPRQLVVRRPGPAGDVPDAGNCRADQPVGAAADSRHSAGGGEPVLAAGAVWMWNSALAGSDQPAGACGAADTSEAACAAATELTVEDAWRNHAINARQCAEDRANHQALIDYITQRNHQEH